MSTRMAIWDKKTPIITPSGEVFTAEQWIDRYPVAALSNITILCAKGETNGALFGTLGSLKEQHESMGCDFSDCKTDQEILDRCEEFDDERAAKAAEDQETSSEELTAAALTSIAASMEYQNLLTLDDDEEEATE